MDGAATPITSHRGYFRERSRTRVGAVDGLGRPFFPCDVGSRWHRYALDAKDRGKQLTVGGTDAPISLSVEGELRTTVDSFKLLTTNAPVPKGTYMICEFGNSDFAGGRLMIVVNGVCKVVLGGNPLIDFKDVQPEAGRVVSHLKKSDFHLVTTIRQGASGWFDFSDVEVTGDEMILSSTHDDAVCNNLRHPVDRPFFLKTSDTNEWYLFDATLHLAENTIKNPAPDGGGADFLLGTECYNVPRNFKNEADCVVSSQSSECADGWVCGSEGEVAVNPLHDDNFYQLSVNSFVDDFVIYDSERQKETVWTMIALNAPDQLRQRVAWALSQIFAISPKLLNVFTSEVEIYLHYYDIFVRHAFGNYKDVLKEVSLSPMMGDMLSHLNSKSANYAWQTQNVRSFADENFAREVMQLFSIGLHMLNDDGTVVVDPETGLPVPAYDTDDVLSFARAWTGYRQEAPRGNMEDYHGINRIDPMKIKSSWRDPFPKASLTGGYIGDGLPLCFDLPERSFLRKGAKYRYLGSSSDPELMIESFRTEPEQQALITRFVPSSDSELYSSLCDPETVGGPCRHKVNVVLDRNLACHGDECDIDEPRVVQIGEKFYEYVRVPCVGMSFFPNAKKIMNQWRSLAVCGDPRLAIASEACCAKGSIRARRNCRFTGERVTYDTGKERCAEIGRTDCAFDWQEAIVNRFDCQVWLGVFWHKSDCDVKMKIDTTGKVAIMHYPDGESQDIVGKHVREDTENYFKVQWSSSLFPNKGNCCGNDACEASPDGDGCVCPVTIREGPVFTDDSPPVDAQDVLDRLHVGSAPVEVFDSDAFEPAESKSDLIVHFKKGTTSYDADTVFEIVWNTKRVYRKNVRSDIVILGGKRAGEERVTYLFRNPPAFHSLAFDHQQLDGQNNAFIDGRDALYETEAVLDGYFYHPNVAPFIVSKLIQRLGTSNPSPDRVRSATTAFRTGRFEYEGISFGTGKYGDLGATVAAVLLHDDVVSPLASLLDPTAGQLREPVLKLLGFMRAMEFSTRAAHKNVIMHDMQQKIGQMAHNIPSVFSFFEKDYVPPGPVADAGLVSPEASLYNTPNIVGFLNGVFSMIKFGLNECHHGFGYDPWDGPTFKFLCDDVAEGDFRKANGRLTYTPTSSSSSAAVVDELAELLTPGRLDDRRRAEIVSAYERQGGGDAGLRLAQQLMVATPEFHSTNYVPMTDNDPETTPTPHQKGKDYKAVVVLFLDGGMDGYNMLVPFSECKKNLDVTIRKLRGSLAMGTSELLPIDTDDSVQPCKKFGVHNHLPIVKKLYDDGELAFLANIGLLFRPVTPKTWEAATKTQLFAHNTQLRDTQQVDPFQKNAGTGVLGRMADVLTDIGLQTGSYAMSDMIDIVAANDGESPKFSSIGSGGVSTFDPKPSDSEVMETVEKLNKKSNAGAFGETFSSSLHQSFFETDLLSKAMNGASISTNFANNELGKQFRNVAKLVDSRDVRGVDRDFFVTHLRGFDTHSSLNSTLKAKFVEVNRALDDFVTEMKSQGTWNDITVLVLSEFGRTLTPNNSAGSDHSWANNLFMLGGSVKGGRVHGRYPDDFSSNGPINIGRGRLIPTTSFASVWNGISEWSGILGDPKLNRVVSHRKNFVDLFTKSDLYKNF